MSETHLIYLIYLLVLFRLVSHLSPQLISKAATRRSTHETIDSIVYAGVAALVLIHFVVRSFYIPSGSMIPTLLVNDYILVNELEYTFSRPMRGDIAVFRPPDSYEGDKPDLIKRVIGIEGDVIEVKEGKLWRNGVQIDEPWVKEPIDGQWPLPGEPKHVVKPGCCFMMGDNRNNSSDSRVFGDVPLQNYVGRAVVIFWPPSRMGLLH